MKNSKVLKGILIVLGLNLIIIGSWRLFDAHGFAAINGIIIVDNNVAAINEAKGAAGAIIAFGLLIMSGVFSRKLSYTSILTVIFIYLGFGIARLISYIVDGYPSEMIITGMIGEFVFGLIGVFALIRYRTKS
jgi:hypothetical protein